jgi:hypothetical protein
MSAWRSASGGAVGAPAPPDGADLLVIFVTTDT